MANVESVINQRRRQILIHSFLYYVLDRSFIDDRTFDKWSRELVELQTVYPNVAATCVYAKAFKRFDGTTGFKLPADLWVQQKAFQVLNYHLKSSQHN